MAAVVDWAILKVVQPCNLNCDYCYVYNRGDSSWRSRPALMTDEVLDAFCVRMREQVQAHGLPSFHVEFHGGEPLLIGRDRFARFCQRIRAAAPCHVHFHLQTNAVLLDEAWLQVFDQYDVSFGVSLDGPPDVHDAHRRDHAGRGSGERVIRNLQRLSRDPAFSRLFGGVLAVLTSPVPDGATLCRWFVNNGIRSFDFLMPDGNWANLPAGWNGNGEFVRFWTEVYETWKAYGDDAPNIRTLETMIRGVAGLRPTLDAHGADLRSMVVVESDGAIGVSDVGRICPPLNNDIHNVLLDPLSRHQVREDVAQLQSLCDTCKACSYVVPCGGGYLPHRYNGADFRSPSLYCETWAALIQSIADDIGAELLAV